MPGRWRTGLLVVAVGVLLVANPWWAFGGLWVVGDRPTRTTTYAAEPVESVPETVLRDGPVLDCDVAHYRTRACSLERRVAAEGTVVVAVDDPAEHRPRRPEDDGLRPATVRSYDHPYVRLEDGEFYRSTANATGDAVVLSLTPVDEREVLDFLSYEFDLAPEVARRAVENGSATTTRYRAERFASGSVDPPLLVERDGRFYVVAVRESTTERPPSKLLVDGTRLAGWLGGFALVLYGRELQVRSFAE